MLSVLRPVEPGFWERLRRLDIERRLMLLLFVAAAVSGVATYWVITGIGDFATDGRILLVLLILDQILLLALGLIVARRMVLLWAERRQGSAGSRLHVRLVVLFGLVASIPGILVAIFSVFFLSAGLENWFSQRVRGALDNSLAVAEAYLIEHKEIIRADALAMAADLNREGPLLMLDPAQLRQFLSAQAALRSLTEAVIMDGTGLVLARTGLSFTMELDQVPQSALEAAARGEVFTFTNDSDDRVRALLRLDGFGDAYLYVGRFVDSNVLGFMEQTQRTVSEYRQLESERSAIQITSTLLFGSVALLLLLASVWVGLNFANELVTPISRLISAANRVRTGDLMARVPEGPDEDEIQVLSRAFNRMTSQLAGQRQELIEANQQLDARRRFTEAVLAGVTAGIIGLDGHGRIMLPNRSALDFLAVPGEEPVGRLLVEILPEAAPLLQRLQARPDEPVQEEILVKRGGRERSLLVRIAAQLDGDEPVGFVVAFDDVTDLISAQRQAAWAEVARRIAHEVKNPLTPIRLAAERLNRKYLGQISEDREAFTSCTRTIVQQVDTIGRLITEFSAFARMPAPVMERQSATELVRQAVVLQQSAWPQIQFAIELPPGDPVELTCDREKVGQVLTNLLQNAVDALSELPPERRPAEPRITVRVVPQPHGVAIEIEDNGPGFTGPNRERLFDPYVTTRPRGTGLGLAIVRKIMEEHGGKVELADAGTGGALVRLAFPESRS